MRRLVLFFSLCLGVACAAQDLGNVGIRTINATVVNGATCTGSAQNFATNSSVLNALGFRNIGQTSHLATATSNASQFQMEIDGIDNLNNAFRLSDLQLGVPSSARGGLVVTASGYMPTIQISVTCTAGATFSISYSGSYSPQPPNIAGALLSSVEKLPFQTAPANASSSTTFQTPSGNSQGTIVFQYAAAGPSGSVINAQCISNAGISLSLFTFNPTTVSTAQLFNVPAGPCPFVTLSYVSGGASGTTYNLEYVFVAQGTNTNTTTVNGTVSTIPPANATTNLTQVNSVALGSPSNYGTSPGAVAVPGVNAFVTNNVSTVPPANATTNLTQVNGVGLGSPSNYGTSPGAVAVPGVNAFITNTPAVGQIQPATTKNTETTSAANTAQTVSIAAVGGQKVYLASFAIRASASGPVCGVTVKDGVGGTVIWSTDANFVSASTRTATWTVPLASSLGNGMDIVVSACGGALTSTLDVQASQL